MRGKVYFSGTLITSIFNFLLIVVLGTHDEGVDITRHEVGGYGDKQRSAVELPPAGAHTADPDLARAV